MSVAVEGAARGSRADIRDVDIDIGSSHASGNNFARKGVVTMRTFDLGKLFVVGVTLLAGCAVQLDGESDEASAEETQEISSTPVALEGMTLADNGMDGRAAAAAEAQVAGESAVASEFAVSSWFSGSVAPGVTQHWFWNNSPLTFTFAVGLSPVGASTTSPCQFQVTRTWDVQQFGGEREFHFFIRNTGTITCGATILLAAQTRIATWPTGGIEAGATQGWTWNNANPLNGSYFVNMSPQGATSINPCQIEASRRWYSQLSTGERKFHFILTNVGSIACQGDVQLALTTTADFSWSTGTLSPGASRSWVWNNANPITKTYVPGLSPTGASGSSTCQLELTSTTYQQVIRADGTAERKFFLTVKNVGSLSCSGTVLLTNLG